MARTSRIRFLPWGDRRIAYELRGEGPPLVAPAWWVSHLGLEDADADVARFWEALAAGFTLVRYDQLGVGLSDRTIRDEDLSLAHQVAVLEALIENAGLERVTLLGASGGGAAAIAYAARHPARVERLLFYGSFADGTAIAPPPVQEAILATVRAHWGLGSRMLAGVFLGEADREAHERFARFQREAATGETAAALLELVYRLDVRAELAAVRTPAVVVHRRGDRAIPARLGRELSAGLPRATLVPLAGDAHFPWFGDAGAVVRALRGEPASPPRDAAGALLSAREREVLVLVAEGLTDEEIAGRLVLSPHTVHRHVANIRLKLGRPSRSAAVAEAARRGLL